MNVAIRAKTEEVFNPEKHIFNSTDKTLLGSILYIKLNLCVSGIEIHTIWPILTKFGMGA
jgi:hypothetical protein